jgi:hypothetical protein
MPDTPKKKTYLGDGLYGEWDGFGIWVTSENGIEVLNRVYFEPSVLQSLVTAYQRWSRGQDA